MLKNVKNIFSIFLHATAWLTSVIFRHQVIDILKLYVNKTQWYALKRRFGSIGKGSYIEAPFIVNNPHNIFIGNNFGALSRFVIEAWEEHRGDRFTPQIVIGDNVSFYHDCHVGCINRIEIGNNVLLASKVYITDHFHGDISSEELKHAPAERKLYSKGPVIIKNNVWIGEGVTILPGVTIGENAIIGANSVVAENIPSNSVAAGVPARVIKTLKP
jgi:acetyltransferase-like isoleucine patch superfamily enzyme